MLLATPENMEKCKDIPGVVVLDIETGEECNAASGNYFDYAQDRPIGRSVRGCPLVLAVSVCKWVDPITGEDIIAQIPAEEN